MALFKISKGVKANLPSNKTEGYCYFTTDDGKFYIDVNSTTRQILNAGHADTATKATNATNAEHADEANYATSAGTAGSATSADKATKLTNPRTISLAGDMTGSASFDGTEDITITAELTDTGVSASAYGPLSGFALGPGSQLNVPYITVDSDGRITSASTKIFTMPADNNTDTKVIQNVSTQSAEFPVLLPYSNSPVSGTDGEVNYATSVTVNPGSGAITAATFKGNLIGNVTGDLNGKASTAGTADYATEAGTANSAATATNATSADAAVKLKNERKISLTGDVAGSVSFDGTKDVIITAELSNTGVTASGYGPSANASPSHGGSFNVPQITVDEDGRITAAATRTITLPADNNTDTKVTQAYDTSTNKYPVLLSSVSGVTSTASRGASTSVINNNIYAIPSEGTIAATKFSGALVGNVTGDLNGKASTAGNADYATEAGTANSAAIATNAEKASSADKWTSGRKIALTGDITGSVSNVDGSADISIATELSNTGVTSGSYGPNANATPGHSGGFTVPYITVDEDGRITAASNKTITLPADNNTNTAHTHGASSGLVVSGTGGISGEVTYGLATLNSSGTYGSNQSPAHGSGFTIPKITVDAYGRVSSVGEATITLPADNNTDTKNTAGATNSSAKLFLVGASAQTANPQTYSHDTAYVGTDGCLYSNSKQTLTGIGTASTDSGVLSHSSSFSVVTGITTSGANVIPTVTTYTMPSDNNTDTKVTQDAKSDNVNYPLLGAYSSAPTSGTASTVVYDTGMHMNPSTNTITATKFKGALEGNADTATKATQDAGGKVIADTYETKADATAKLSTAQADATTKANAALTSAKEYADTKTSATLTSANSYTDTEIDGLRDELMGPGSSEALDTIKELADAITDNAETITTLQAIATNKQDKLGTISLTGDITGSKAINTSGVDISITTELSNTGVTAGSYGPSANATPSHSSGFSVPYITVDEDGRITAAATRTITLPADNNTDTKNTAGSTDSSSKLFLVGATSQAANPQTYSHDTAYVGTDGCLYSNSKQTLTGTGTASTASVTTSHGGTFTAVTGITTSGANIIPTVTTYTLPADNNTDTKVTQAYSTASNSYPLLMTATSGITSTSSRGAKTSILNNSIYAIPSSGTIVATTFSGTATYATEAGTATSATTAGTANSAANADKLDGYDSSSFAKLASANTFTANQSITLSGNPYLKITNSNDSKVGYIQLYDSNQTVDTKMGLGFGWANSFVIDQSGNAVLPGNMTADNFVGLATNATEDAEGNDIVKTYATKSELAGVSASIPSISASDLDRTGNAIGSITINDTTTNFYETPNPTAFTITPTVSGDGVINLQGTAGSNKVTITGTHTKVLNTTYSSNNETTSISGYGSSGTIKIPQISVDAYGHVTAASNESVTITMPTQQDLSSYFKKTGDTITGKIGITQDVNYGTTLPTSPIAGELFFLEEDCRGVTTAASTAKRYVCGVSGAGSNQTTINYNTGVYTSGSVLYGAAWNDYAEYRETKEKEIPYGRVVIENGDDTLSLSTERLQPGGNVCSDTFGFAIGETEKAQMPIAVSGRALVYTNEPRDTYKAGDAVCTGPNGTVSKMTREEIREYPDRIIGYVSAVPSYTIWGENNVLVKGRIWIKVV